MAMITRKIFYYIISIVFFLSIGSVAFLMLLPWYVSLSLLIVSLIVWTLILIRPEFGAYFLLIYVPVFSHFIGICLNVNGNIINKGLPFFIVILVIGLISIGIRKATKLHKDSTTKNPLSIPLIILIAYGMLTLLWAPSLGYNLIVFSLLTANVLMFYFFTAVIENEKLHRQFMWCWVFSGIIIAILTVLSISYNPQIAIGKPILNIGSYKAIFFFDYPSWKAWRLDQYRGHAIGHPNSTSLSLNLAICVTAGLLLVEKVKFKKIFLTVALLLMVFADFLTMSRAGIGSFLIMGYVIIFFSSALRKKIVVYSIIFAICFGLMFVGSVIYSKKAAAPGLLKAAKKEDIVSLENRFVIWQKGLSVMEKKSFLISGLGVGNFAYYTKYPHSHNLYLSFFFDFGLVGIIFLIIILLIFIKLVKDIFKVIYIQRTYFHTMSLVFFAGMLAIGIHSLVDFYYNKDSIWLFLALFISTLKLTKDELGTATNGVKS